MRINHNQHKKIMRIALPMMLSNITTPLLGLVDTAILGHLDSPNILAGVALGAMVITMLGWTFGFLRMGTSGRVAQAFGAKDHLGITVLLIQSILIALCIGLALLALQTPLASLAFKLTQSSQSIQPVADSYFAIRIWAIPATLVNAVLLGWFLGVQYARAPLVLLVGMNVTNILLDTVLIVVLEMGAEGAAWASLIAEYFGLCLGLLMLAERLKTIKADKQITQQDLFHDLTGLIKINSDIFLRTLALQVVFYGFTAQGTQFGAVVFAANAVLMNFLLLISNALDGVAHATEALIGESIGQKSKRQFKLVVAATGQWTTGFAILLTSIFGLFGQEIIMLLTDLPEVKEQAFNYLPYMIALPIIATWSYWLDGLFIGANLSRGMRNTMLLATFCGFIPAWYFLSPWQNHGLWFAFLIFMFVRAGLMVWQFQNIKRDII